jgi:hypothetical protein
MKDKIENFWQWFVAHEDKIVGCLEDNGSPHRDFVIEHLNNYILSMGMFKWDIGEGADKTWFLTISPNGDPDLLEKSKQIIAQAPPNLDWEYHYALQPKAWDYTLSVYDYNMDEQHVDASNWKYQSDKSPNGQYNITFIAENISHIDADTKAIIADLVIVNEIGEAAKISTISDVQIIDGESNLAMQNPIQSLKENLLY